MMVLGDDEPAAGGIRGGDERVGVDGLDRVEVDHARVDPVKRELIGRTEAFVQGDARTDTPHRQHRCFSTFTPRAVRVVTGAPIGTVSVW